MLKHHQLFHLLHRLLHHIQIMLTLLRKLKKQDQLQHRRSFHHVFLLHEGIPYPRVFPFQLRISEAFRFRSVYQFQYGCKPVHTADHKDRLLRNNQLMDCFHGITFNKACSTFVFTDCFSSTFNISKTQGTDEFCWIRFCWAALAARGIMAEKTSGCFFHGCS